LSVSRPPSTSAAYPLAPANPAFEQVKRLAHPPEGANPRAAAGEIAPLVEPLIEHLPAAVRERLPKTPLPSAMRRQMRQPLSEAEWKALDQRELVKRVVTTVRAIAHQIAAAEVKLQRTAGRKRTLRTPARTRQILAALILRWQGYPNETIEAELGLERGEVARMLHVARHFGYSDLAERLDGVALVQATENALQGVSAGDPAYTLAVLKGRGSLRHYSNVRQTGQDRAPTVLMVKIEGGNLADPAVATAGGQIVGQPRVALPSGEPERAD
jgi:hypothetical protein